MRDMLQEPLVYTPPFGVFQKGLDYVLQDHGRLTGSSPPHHHIVVGRFPYPVSIGRRDIAAGCPL